MEQVAAPSREELAGIARDYHLALSDAELDAVTATAAGMAAVLDGIGDFAPLCESLVPRVGVRPSRSPEPSENPTGGWYVQSEIRTRDEGPLAGRRIAVKDSIAVGGIPMANGSPVLGDYVPDFDATVVSRVLAAGGTVAGKAVCEPMCMAAFGDAAHTGPVRNPHDPGRAPGGSSSGCAALVGARAVDMAIGGDNGGSIRIPASWCGVYGLKPSWGLVPYTGAMSMNPQIDHLGPMAASMADLELLLGVLAGPDGLDPRQLAGHVLREACFGSIGELQVGVLDEAFGWPGKSDPRVDAAVDEAVAAFGRLGARVSRVSIPLHREGQRLVGALGIEMGRDMFENDAIGGPLLGYVSPTMTEHFHQAWRGHAHLLDLPSKVQLVASRHFLAKGMQSRLALARNLGLVLRKVYDDALRDVDVLVMPTVTHLPGLLPETPFSPAETLAAAWDQSRNTRPFNLTGHPGLNVPCAMVDGLPVGMQIVGRAGDDATVMRAGRLFADHVYTAPAPERSLSPPQRLTG